MDDTLKKLIIIATVFAFFLVIANRAYTGSYLLSGVGVNKEIPPDTATIVNHATTRIDVEGTSEGYILNTEVQKGGLEVSYSKPRGYDTKNGRGYWKQGQDTLKAPGWIEDAWKSDDTRDRDILVTMGTSEGTCVTVPADFTNFDKQEDISWASDIDEWSATNIAEELSNAGKNINEVWSGFDAEKIGGNELTGNLDMSITHLVFVRQEVELEWGIHGNHSSNYQRTWSTTNIKPWKGFTGSKTKTHNAPSKFTVVGTTEINEQQFIDRFGKSMKDIQFIGTWKSGMMDQWSGGASKLGTSLSDKFDSFIGNKFPSLNNESFVFFESGFGCTTLPSVGVQKNLIGIPKGIKVSPPELPDFSVNTQIVGQDGKPRKANWAIQVSDGMDFCQNRRKIRVTLPLLYKVSETITAPSEIAKDSVFNEVIEGLSNPIHQINIGDNLERLENKVWDRLKEMGIDNKSVSQVLDNFNNALKRANLRKKLKKDFLTSDQWDKYKDQIVARENLIPFLKGDNPWNETFMTQDAVSQKLRTFTSSSEFKRKMEDFITSDDMMESIVNADLVDRLKSEGMITKTDLQSLEMDLRQTFMPADDVYRAMDERLMNYVSAQELPNYLSQIGYIDQSDLNSAISGMEDRLRDMYDKQLSAVADKLGVRIDSLEGQMEMMKANLEDRLSTKVSRQDVNDMFAQYTTAMSNYIDINLDDWQNYTQNYNDWVNNFRTSDKQWEQYIQSNPEPEIPEVTDVSLPKLDTISTEGKGVSTYRFERLSGTQDGSYESEQTTPQPAGWGVENVLLDLAVALGITLTVIMLLWVVFLREG